jgi:predicted dehydrogenase
MRNVSMESLFASLSLKSMLFSRNFRGYQDEYPGTNLRRTLSSQATMFAKNKIRLGVIGVGGMGGGHAREVLAGKIKGCELAAVCDSFPAVLERFPEVKGFTDAAKMIQSGEVEAILIATPHFTHTSLGILALQQGLHVLVEKPISVDKADSERLVAAHKNPKQIFAAMFNVRTDPRFIELNRLVKSGELGTIRRVNWIVTDWYRTNAYYASGTWRATWAGEGGGLLVNQCPHNLDLLQWIFGMPKTVRGFCHNGRYHDIEVEDDVTAYFEYENGATGVFISTTGEAPGTNRLEVVGENGRVLVETDHLAFKRNVTPMTEFSRTAPGGFDRPAAWDIQIPAAPASGGHAIILQNFVDAILDGKPLIAPAAEGINSVELANSIILSSFLKKEIELPMSSAEYAAFLKEKMHTSRYHAKVAQAKTP